MSQLELFTDTERVVLRLQREPAAVCAETLHRIRLSVKADRQWRVRIPYAAFAVFGLEPADVAPTPSPTLCLNGEQIVTMSWREADAFILKPVVSVTNTWPAVLFKDSIGAVSLSIESSVGTIHTEAFFLSLKRGFVANYVSKMADYVVDRLNVWAKEPTLDERAGAFADETTFASELQNRLDSIERTLKTFEQLLPYFRTNAKFELVSQESVDGVGRLTGFSHSTLRHVIEHPEDLVPSSHGTGIRIHNRYYMPRHTLVETKRKTFDLPENRLMLGFLDRVTEVLAAEVEAVGIRRSQLPNVLKVEDDYVSDHGRGSQASGRTSVSTRGTSFSRQAYLRAISTDSAGDAGAIRRDTDSFKCLSDDSGLSSGVSVHVRLAENGTAPFDGRRATVDNV